MSLSNSLVVIGIFGLSNSIVLMIIISIRVLKYIQLVNKSDSIDKKVYYKKLTFFSLLFLAAASDVPLYIGFILYNNYILSLYSFHKFETALLFGAYSITIYDWMHVLKDIAEESIYPFLTRKIKTIYYFNDITLISINILFFLISITNFIYCFVSNNLQEFLESYVYLVGVFTQIIASFLLNVFMLYAGLRLHIRIKGVTGALDNNRYIGPELTRSLPISHPGVSQEFRNALRSLNIVMATISICLFIQMMLLILNYALGYSNQSGVYVGPFYFYWTFYAFVPMTGPVIALLYLSRNSFISKDFQQNYMSNDSFPNFDGVARVNSNSTTDNELSGFDPKTFHEDSTTSNILFNMRNGSDSNYYSEEFISPEVSSNQFSPKDITSMILQATHADNDRNLSNSGEKYQTKY